MVLNQLLLSMPKLKDQEIVDQLKSGNTDVFKYLYADFDIITSFISQNHGGEEDAKDFFHEALIILYEKIINNEFELKSKLSTYLFSVCKNLWLYHLRDKKPMLFNSIDDKDKTENIFEDIVEYEENRLIKEEALEIIIQKIKELKEPCYSILMMFYFKKMSYLLIAEQLNYKTEKVVKNQKYRCLQKLKESMPKNFLEMY